MNFYSKPFCGQSDNSAIPLYQGASSNYWSCGTAWWLCILGPQHSECSPIRAFAAARSMLWFPTLFQQSPTSVAIACEGMQVAPLLIRCSTWCKPPFICRSTAGWGICLRCSSGSSEQDGDKHGTSPVCFHGQKRCLCCMYA